MGKLHSRDQSAETLRRFSKLPRRSMQASQLEIERQRSDGGTGADLVRAPVGQQRCGRAVVLDDEMGHVEDSSGSRCMVVRKIIGQGLFDKLRIGSQLHFRENVHHSVAN